MEVNLHHGAVEGLGDDALLAEVAGGVYEGLEFGGGGHCFRQNGPVRRGLGIRPGARAVAGCIGLGSSGRRRR